MKVGDKVYCINGYSGVKLRFTKGKIYNVIEILHFGNHITYIIDDDFKEAFEASGWFHEYSSDFKFAQTFGILRLYNDYFISIKDLRKLKLKKLENV